MRFDGEKNRLTSFKITIGNLKKIAANICATSAKNAAIFLKIRCFDMLDLSAYE